MRNASLCIGVVDYEHPAYGSSSGRLAFATGDAKAFSNYLKSAFPGPHADLEHRLLLDREATFANAERALAELTEAGDLDLFVLYLAGHGERGQAEGGWFCLADAAPSSRSLDGAKLEQLLTAVRAHSVLVVIDCCHAEAVIGGGRYFTLLEDGRARLFIASARRDQLAWEDARLQRSVLSDVFLRACSTTSPIQSNLGTIKVESALFPYLREQVPLLAAAQKQGSVQEPVTGGAARTDVELPIVPSRSFGRQLSIAQTVRARLRQVLVKGALAVLLLVAGVQMLAYHLTADSAGRILLRPGLPLTHALLPVGLVEAVDTGFRVEDLSAQERDVNAVAQSKLWGVASHLDVDGIRPWFRQLAPLLNGPVRIRTQVLSVAGEPALLPEGAYPPIEQALFLSFLRKEWPAAVAGKLYPPQHVRDAIECAPEARMIDFTILSVPSAAFASDLWWQSVLAMGDQAKADAAILSQVASAAYRARMAKLEEEPAKDIAPLALSLAALSFSTSRSIDLQKTLVAQLDTPCRAHAALAIRSLGSQADNERAEALLVRDLETFDRDKQGDLPNNVQVTAAYALAVMAGSRPLLDTTITALGGALVRDDPNLERPTLARTVLLAAAVNQPLPAPLLDHLFARLEAPERLHQFGHLAALELLSRNIRFLAPDRVRRLSTWLNANAPRQHTMSDIHAALGFLLSVDAAPQGALIQLLVNQLSPDTYFSVPPYGYRGELVISSRGDAAAIALGRALTLHSLSDDVMDRLARFAMGREDVPERQVIVDGFAKRWYADTANASDIQTRLTATNADARRRLLEVEVACSRLTQLSEKDRGAILAALVSLWRIESEPELRLAMAQIIARSQWPRYANMTMCKQTERTQ